MVTYESEKEKYDRWLAGKEAAKKMWYRKYCEMRAQRDEALYLLRANKASSGLPTGVRYLIALSVGLNLGGLLWLLFGSR